MHIPKPRKGRKNSSPENLRKKRKLVTELAKDQLGEDGPNFYIAEEIRRKGKEEREVLLVEMGLADEMTVEEGLAMLVDMGLTWNLFRKYKR